MAIAAAVIPIATPIPAIAADFDFVLPAGAACTFELHVTGTGGSAITREFTDADGNIVRTLTAGRGSDLTFENVSTGATIPLKGNGSVTSATINPVGPATVRSTGHNVILMFPTDVPAGPSTTLYIGRVTYQVDAQNTFTITGSSGRTRDICAELE
ncbi:hypothetical protein [Microbacterium sp. SS28]|uniref:hypothetical protein n=1 Tax=Microbacterium sp. SS28 TaxID=2919948 RepID=UPI001FA9E84D|nr:hypothetical protein [Microbacterium sp. SS28]